MLSLSTHFGGWQRGWVDCAAEGIAMAYGYFLTELVSVSVRGTTIDAAFKAIRVTRATAGALIAKHHLTPYSIEPTGSESFAFTAASIEKVVVCHGSFEQPQVFQLHVSDAVWWVSKGWLSGADQAVAFARLWQQLSCDAGRIAIEVHPLCRTESVTLDDIVQMSRL
jgi:hypothetical protein